MNVTIIGTGAVALALGRFSRATAGELPEDVARREVR
jgi:hypothetical protein